ncbi:MAG: hypothetical protein JWN73_1952 [Betaproteobacteria bacterium]|nr:hypothetical protein [Betaproteobacteria bacterium]
MTDTSPDDLRRIRDLLPWYVNGTLTAEQRAEVEATLAQSQELRAEAEWLAAVRDQLKQKNDTQADGQREAGAEQAGLQTLLGLVRAEKKKRPALNPGRGHPGFGERLSQWLGGWMQPVFMVAACLVVVQAVVIGTLLHRTGDNSITPAGAAASTAAGPLLQVVFHETATEAALRAALIGASVEIVAGPGQLGVYTVRTAPDRADAAIAVLRQNAAVESVSRVTP